MKTAPYWAHMTSFARTLAYDVRLCNGGAVPVDRLVRIAVPVLAMAGGASAPWAREVADAIADAAPDAERRVLDGQGHGVADEVLVPVLEERFLGRIP